MIERKLVQEKLTENAVSEYIDATLSRAGVSHTKLKKTPLGTKVIIFASKPGLVVGRKGQNIKQLTDDIHAKFGIDNPQIEVNQIDNPNLDPKIVAEKIASALERFGQSRFKAIGHKAIQDVMNAGALGIEILVSGKIPSARAKTWRLFQGYLKKSGDVAVEDIRRAIVHCTLKVGTMGIQVSIMPPDIILPDKVILKDLTKKEEVKTENNTPKKAEEAISDAQKEIKENLEKAKKAKEKKAPKKRAPKKAKEEETKVEQ